MEASEESETEGGRAMKKPTKRLTKDKDWDKWAVKLADGGYWNWTFEKRPSVMLTRGQKLVRVKFVEIKGD
jgi:hypothetical protein